MPNSLERPPFATHFHWKFSTHPWQVPQPHQYTHFLCQLICRPEGGPKPWKFATRLSTLASSALTLKYGLSTYWLMLCWELHRGRALPLIRPILIAFQTLAFNVSATIMNKYGPKGQPCQKSLWRSNGFVSNTKYYFYYREFEGPLWPLKSVTPLIIGRTCSTSLQTTLNIVFCVIYNLELNNAI